MYFKEIDEKINGVISSEDSARVALNNAKKTKKEIATFFRDIDEAKGKIEKVAAEIEKTYQLLPSEISDTEYIGILKKMSDELHIKEMSITPEKDDDHGFYITRKYRFAAKATYLQFLIMFEKIGENKRILNGEFTLEAYKFNNSFKEDRGIDKIEKDFKDKAGSSTPIPKAAKPQSDKAEP